MGGICVCTSELMSNALTRKHVQVFVWVSVLVSLGCRGGTRIPRSAQAL